MSTPQVQLTIDGTLVTVPAGTTIFDAARMNGIAIPTSCHQQNETPWASAAYASSTSARAYSQQRAFVPPRMEPLDLFAEGEKRPAHTGRASHGRSPRAVRPAAALRRLRARILARVEGHAIR